MHNDTSHITKKIRQCFLYLLYNPFKLKSEGESIIKIDEAEKRVKKGFNETLIALGITHSSRIYQ